MAGPSFHLQCPSCGQALLTQVEHPQMVVSCPHCGFNGLRLQFPVLPAPASRRESKRFTPTTQSGHVAAAPPPVWEVQQYQAVNGAPVAPSLRPTMAAPPTPHRPARDQTNWAGVQAYNENAATRFRPSGSAPPVVEAEMVPPSPSSYAQAGQAVPLPPAAADWAPMKPSAMPRLTPWPGLEPAHQGAEAPVQWPSSGSPHTRRIPWVWVMAASVIMALIVTISLERTRANAAMAELAIKARAEAKPAPPAIPGLTQVEDGTIAKALPVDAAKLPREMKMSPAESEAVARPLLDRLFNAASNEERLACIASPRRQADRLKAFFSQHERVEIKAVTEITKPVRCLPAPAPQTMFEVLTSLNPTASGILRLTTDDDGALKIDWPLLSDSLEGRFAAFQAQPVSNPQWISLGLRRNFGFAQPATERETYYFFDVQGYGNGTDHAVLQVLKDSPTGRAINSGVAWDDLYVVRVLLDWQPVNGTPRMTIANAVLDASDVDQ